MKENAIKWKKIVVDVQNIVFYRRSIGFVRLCGKGSIVLYGDSYRRSIGLYGEDQ